MGHNNNDDDDNYDDDDDDDDDNNRYHLLSSNSMAGTRLDTLWKLFHLIIPKARKTDAIFPHKIDEVAEAQRS